jgi:nicotinamidase-related amidase
MLLEAARSLLLIVDMQERLLPAMADAEAVVEGCRKLMAGAARLGVPVLVSEQYPQGLGPTVAPLKALAPAGAVLAKVHFSCAADPGIAARLAASGRDQVVIAGIEAHVCVAQTALALRRKGVGVAVAADAVSSRRRESVALALQRLATNGVELVNVEMALFEWLGAAGTPAFKDISALIR